MKYKKFIAFLILFSYLLINVGSAGELPNGMRFKDENITWVALTYIITPINDSTQTEVIFHFHYGAARSLFNSSDINQVGILLSDIEFYIGNEKKDFDEFFVLATYEGGFKIYQKNKNVLFNESTDLRFKYNVKIPSERLYFDKNITLVKLKSDFNLEPNKLFIQYIFRVPSVNAQNIKLTFQASGIGLINPENKTLFDNIPAPVSRVDVTDKYIDISYVFWNEDLSHQVIWDELSLTLNPNTKYYFVNSFSIEYDSVKWDLILQAVVVAILLTITFYLGTLWQRKSINIERKKPPK